MKIVADLHTHTNVSDHAFNTILEMCTAANKAGLKAIAITNHTPAISDGAHEWHFSSLSTFLPRIIEGVYVIRGCEANILEPDGRLDIANHRMDKLDMVVASIHNETFLEKNYDKITNILLKVLKNDYVNILGHMGSPAFEFDYEKIISKCNEYKKVIEVNNNSFFSRKGSKENCEDIIKLCKKYEVPISVNSDAHFSYAVGQVEESLRMVEDAGFPEELVINATWENLVKYFKEYKDLDINDPES